MYMASILKYLNAEILELTRRIPRLFEIDEELDLVFGGKTIAQLAPSCSSAREIKQGASALSSLFTTVVISYIQQVHSSEQF